MADKPELKQFGELLPADFDRHPVWVGVHTCRRSADRFARAALRAQTPEWIVPRELGSAIRLHHLKAC